MKHLRIAVFVTLVVTALLVLQGTTIAPVLFSTTQQQRAVEVDLRRQLQVANRELASVQERLELASAQGQRLQERLDSQKTPPAAVAQEPPQPATAEAQRWDDTPDHRRLYELLNRVANPRREVMVGLVNDVMMCTNRRTCWWDGGGPNPRRPHPKPRPKHHPRKRDRPHTQVERREHPGDLPDRAQADQPEELRHAHARRRDRGEG